MHLLTKTGEMELSTETVRALALRWKTRDVESELLKAHLWLLRYPTRRPAYIWRFLDRWMEKAPAVKMPPTIVSAWWSTDERTINQGEAVGLRPRPGDSMAQFKERLAEHMRKSA